MKALSCVLSLLLIGMAVFCFSGCAESSKKPEGQANTSESRTVTLKFDAQTCQYEGPETIAAGDLTITLLNATEYEASIWLVRLDDGKTWQDLLDYIGPPGSNMPPPAWSSSNIMTNSVPDQPNARIYTLEQGLYAVCCCTCWETAGPQGVWPGAALKVIEENHKN